MPHIHPVLLVPLHDVSWYVTLDGQLHVSWLRKISQFGENNPVEISWMVGGDTGSSTGTVLHSTIPSLILGKTYTASLMDLREEGSLSTFKFVACKLYYYILCELYNLISLYS